MSDEQLDALADASIQLALSLPRHKSHPLSELGHLLNAIGPVGVTQEIRRQVHARLFKRRIALPWFIPQPDGVEVGKP